MKTWMIVVPALCLAACATKPEADKSTPEKVGEAVISPLNDLNLVQASIPEVLQAAAAAPYGPPAPDSTCEQLTTSIHALDAVLGLDLDAPASADSPSLLERGVGQVENASVSALKNTTQSIVPFRSWVRKLTGAERYSKKVSAAITAGGIRRAYLKGVSHAKGCTASANQVAMTPAAPATR
jgi:hypothetical protein